MKDKEISEIKRTLTLKRNTVPAIYGCYVNAGGEVIAKFKKSLGLMGEEETEKYLALFCRVLSGGRNKNIFEIPFSTKQVTDSEEHRLLMSLRNAEEPAEEDFSALIAKITSAYSSDDNYAILFLRSRYDVVTRSHADTADEDGKSVEIFTYTLCAVCPVKATKADLAYDADEKDFLNMGARHAICMPDVGFMFPAFDNRRTNIYAASFYTKSTDTAHEALTSALFGSGIGMTAKAQNETFRETLAAALDESLSFDVAKALHTEVSERMREYKESRSDEPMVLTQSDIADCLSSVGVDEEKLKAFTDTYKENFGPAEELEPKNIVNPKKFELKTPDVFIKVAEGKENLVTTKVINGKRYIIIAADGGVELNGLSVKIEE